MPNKSKISRFRIAFCSFIFAMILVPFQATFAQSASEGITLDKDVFLQGPIQSPGDLPDAVTFSIYDSGNAVVPLAAQSFPRGEYVLDFDFNKSDGLSSGSVARFKVNFTNKLNLDNSTAESKQPRELWVEMSANNTVLGDRTRVPDSAMVQLLLASDASIATYLTLAYEGDSNPIATIYRDLPLSSSAGSSATDYISTLFRVSSSSNVPVASTSSPYWEYLSGNIFYPDGNVGVGTGNNAPTRDISVKYSSDSGGLDGLPTVSVANTHVSTGVTDFSFSSFEFTGGNGAAVGEFFADGSGFFLNGTPNVFFRAGLGTAMLLGANQASNVTISTAGNVGIGLGTTMATNKLDVYGTIRCTELIVTSTWADFVFDDKYKLPALDEVEDFISQNKHLPGIPSEAEVKEKGVSVGSISSKLLQKIEELTLYVIDLKKENESLQGQLVDIREQIGSKNN